MPTIEDVIQLSGENRLAFVSTQRPNSTIQTSLVSAGVLAHPISGDNVVGFVTYGRTKLNNLRSRPQITVAFRAGQKWIAIEGSAELIGPDDPHPGIGADRLPQLLREVFIAAGGTHDDWGEYDRVMADERRVVVLVRAERMYSNRPSR